MKREVITISTITPDRQELDLACGHSVAMDRDAIQNLQVEAMKNRGPIIVECKLCDAENKLPPTDNHVWDQAAGDWVPRGRGPGKFIDVEEVEDLIERLHTRAIIRRQIPNRKSVQEAKPDRIAALLDEAGTTMKELLEPASRAAELQRTFDLRWDADMRAIKRWQAVNPGNDLVWPDRADLVVWLLDRR
jgi:hypothetical protein